MKADEFKQVLTLSPMEHEVFVLIGKGQPTRAIAEQVGRSMKTIETHLLKRALKITARVPYEFVMAEPAQSAA